MIGKPAPVGGTLLTTGYKAILALTIAGFIAIAYRFYFGLGATTAMNDGYPWGIWIAYDVVTGTAIACGGYAVAILVYIFNKGRYHPLVRPAILTSALGYTLAGISVAVDVGRPWHLWKIPVQIWKWNGNSVLLEVAVCIMAYIAVLWLELSPAILEGWKSSDREKLRSFAEKSLPFVNKALIYIIALGMLLPTMHQSSLGSLMMLAGPRIHPLWFTPFMPLYFLITCIGMGYAVVCFESTAAAKFFRTPLETDMLAKLDEMAAAIGGFFVLMRLFEVGARGNLKYAFQPTFFAFAFWCETLLFLGPWFMRLAAHRVSRLQRLVGSGMLVVLGGAVYRFDVFLIGFQPGSGWRYFPSVTEILITAGLVAGEAATYILIIKKFPILSGVTTRPAPQKEVTAAAPGIVAPAH